MNCHDIDACAAGAKNCPMPHVCQHPKLHQIEEPMNNTQKLNDEALQVYRATGLSPVEMMERRNKLAIALSKCRFDSLNMTVSEWREIQETLKACK